MAADLGHGGFKMAADGFRMAVNKRNSKFRVNGFALFAHIHFAHIHFSIHSFENLNFAHC